MILGEYFRIAKIVIGIEEVTVDGLVTAVENLNVDYPAKACFRMIRVSLYDVTVQV